MRVIDSRLVSLQNFAVRLIGWLTNQARHFRKYFYKVMHNFNWLIFKSTLKLRIFLKFKLNGVLIFIFSAALALTVCKVLLNEKIEREVSDSTEADETLMAHIMRCDSALWKGLFFALVKVYRYFLN